MALGVAGLVAQGDTVIDGADDASISYPSFWEHLAYLSGEGPAQEGREERPGDS